MDTKELIKATGIIHIDRSDLQEVGQNFFVMYNNMLLHAIKNDIANVETHIMDLKDLFKNIGKTDEPIYTNDYEYLMTGFKRLVMISPFLQFDPKIINRSDNFKMICRFDHGKMLCKQLPVGS